MRAARRHLWPSVLLVACVVAAGTSCIGPKTLTVTTVIGGLGHPWDLAFTPDGTMLFTERGGDISALTPTGSKQLLAHPADVVATSEGGMLGLAVDPGFAANRRIYTCFTTSFDVRVVRWRVTPAGDGLTDRTDILEGIPRGTGNYHVGCRTRFGPDGHLWVTTGDAGNNDAPQNLFVLAGKVLRITTDGAPAPGNPLPFSGPRREIYTYGHRNPQGLAFRPGDGQPFSVEHGTSCDDEVNEIVAGGNYGWDPAQSGEMTDKVHHPDAIDAVWSSGCPTIAPSGATFLTGRRWAGWDGALAIAVLKDQQLQIMKLGSDDRPVSQWTVMTDRGRLRAAVQGPDGNLYVAQDASPGAILMLVPSSS